MPLAGVPAYTLCPPAGPPTWSPPSLGVALPPVAITHAQCFTAGKGLREHSLLGAHLLQSILPHSLDHQGNLLILGSQLEALGRLPNHPRSRSKHLPLSAAVFSAFVRTYMCISSPCPSPAPGTLCTDHNLLLEGATYCPSAHVTEGRLETRTRYE